LYFHSQIRKTPEVLATGLNLFQSIRPGWPIEAAALVRGIKSRNALGPQ
jgi:hypothetical protein